MVKAGDRSCQIEGLCRFATDLIVSIISDQTVFFSFSLFKRKCTRLKFGNCTTDRITCPAVVPWRLLSVATTGKQSRYPANLLLILAEDK